MPATLLIRNARVHTVDAARPWADAVAIGGDRISWVGDDEDAAAMIGPDTEVIDAGGATVFPGFIDSHNHVRLGSNPLEVDLAGAATFDEVKGRVRAHADAHPEYTWIEGSGFNYSVMPGGRMPTWHDLEGLTGGRPAFLFTYDVHNAWLNREAMEAFGITRDTDALAWGHVRKDPADGEPTGIVGDFAVMGISREGQAALEAVVPGYARNLQYERTLESLDMAIELGITTIVEPQNSPEDMWIFERARDEGRLRSRLVAAMFHPAGTTDAERDEFDVTRERFDDDRLRVGPIKLYIDDVIEPWTAAMLEPYANRPGERGDTFWQPDEFAELVIELERRGWSCHVHGTGDRGLRVALDGFEAARRANGDVGARHGMVHTECLHADDVPRFGALGVTPIMQPRHCAPEIIADWRANVGEERWRHAWAFRSLRDTGATLSFSSDWNVAEMDPMVGIYTALSRANLNGSGTWVPEETVDLETAIRAYTLGGAHVVFAEERRGSITVGKQADLVVLSEDLFAAAEADPRRVLDVRVAHTIVDGEVVHRT
ncbi:MAG: amidohydrolase family protein [Actinomycetota bacterium]|nr:amidohydrolase family protein [Actinomycetota bacterium]